MSIVKSSQDVRGIVFDFLRAIRDRLRIIVLVFLLGSLAGVLTVREIIWPFFEVVMRSKLPQQYSDQVSIIVQTPFDVFFVQLRVGVFIGIILTLPVIAYIFYNDVLRSQSLDLSKIPKTVLLIVSMVGVGLFVGGLIYSYRVFFPLVFRFLVQITVDSGFSPTYAISEWTQFMMILSVSFGLIAQVPLFLPVLVRYNVVSYQSVRDGWRYWIVLTLVLGAMLSPPDPASQILWAGPLNLLYGISVIVSWLVAGRPRNNTDSDEKSEDNEQEAEEDAESDSGNKGGEEDNTGESILQDTNPLIEGYAQYFTIIAASLKSNILIIGSVFLVSMFGSFYFLYDSIMSEAFSLLKGSIGNQSLIDVVALHPVELLILEVKLSVVIALVITVPIAVFRIWPDMRNKNVVNFGRKKATAYVLALLSTSVLGFVVGFSVVTPEILNILALDASRINAIVSYRINSFFWISIYISAASSLLITVYVATLLGYSHSLTSNFMIRKWKEIIFGIIVVSSLLIPGGIMKAALFFLPISAVYCLGFLTIAIIDSIRGAVGN